MIEYIQSPHFQQLLDEYPHYLAFFGVFILMLVTAVFASLSSWFTIRTTHHHYHYYNSPRHQWPYPRQELTDRPTVFEGEYDEWPESPPQRKSRRKNRRKMERSKRFRILNRDGFRCQICGRKADEDGEIELHVDHKMPVSQGGSNDDGNLWTLCADCNLGKSDQIVDEIVKDLDEAATDAEKGGGK